MRPVLNFDMQGEVILSSPHLWCQNFLKVKSIDLEAMTDTLKVTLLSGYLSRNVFFQAENSVGLPDERPFLFRYSDQT